MPVEVTIMPCRCEPRGTPVPLPPAFATSRSWPSGFFHLMVPVFRS
jgi:hypothetical protein